MPDKKQPFCWKCTSKIETFTDLAKSFVLIGCAEEPKIECYDDAKKLCPLLDHSPKKVILTVIDGEVSLVEKPDNVSIEVRDYVEVDDETYPQIHKDEQGDTYRVFSFPATRIKFSANGKQCFTDVEINLGSEQVVVDIEQEIAIDITIIGKNSNVVMKDKGIKTISDLCDYVDSCGGTICSGAGGCNRCMRVDDFPEIAPDGNHFVCKECLQNKFPEELLKSGLKNITILQHNISYYLGENELLTIEVGDSEYEHIHYMITEGYNEGELNKTNPHDEDDTIIGWWRIVK